MRACDPKARNYKPVLGGTQQQPILDFASLYPGYGAANAPSNGGRRSPRKRESMVGAADQSLICYGSSQEAPECDRDQIS